MKHAALALVPALVAFSAQSREPLEDAVDIARWLQSKGRTADRGRVWPIDPEKPEEIVAHLYSGTAGVVLFFLEGKREYLDFALPVTDDALARGSRDASGLSFVQAEHRTRPDLLQAQTGYMQGAAGIGLWLLRLHAFSKGEKSFVVLPDSPFGS